MTVTFAVGPGRCGTRSITQLAADAGATAIHEAKPFLVEMAARRVETRTWLVKDAAVEELKRARTKIVGIEHYFESAHWYSWLLPTVRRAWPEARIIWMTRSLWTWARSAWRRGWYDPAVDDPDGPNGLRGSLLRIQPECGWPDNAGRWYKLGWMYQMVREQIAHDLALTGLPWVELPCELLDNLVLVNAVLKWCGLPGSVAGPARLNAGRDYVTIGELWARGLDPPGDYPHEHVRIMCKSIPKKHGFRDQVPLTEEIFEALTLGAQTALANFTAPIVSGRRK
jgi:hypothetical protein